MTRLENFIKENEIQKVKDDCHHFLTKYPNITLYRGYRKKKDIYIKKFMPRKDREPLHTSMIVSKAFDRASKEVFGWPCRSQGTFTSPVYSEASMYGLPYIFLPIGSSWKYIYTPITQDSIKFTEDLYDIVVYENDKKRYSDIIKELREFLGRFIHYKTVFDDIIINNNILNKKTEHIRKDQIKEILYVSALIIMKELYIDKNFNKITNEEVIFNCQKEGYYLINIEVFQEFIKE